eukprot:TRINITY_DN3073_c0_g1_i1.p1 TRINITY_DN3073_c0_g1~~TRINITY_DN3073_c0_g1_i1.p1  ORF type:complete len:261 (+),score=57.36 TRINITY_DN3073_c0_g1_i1:494-1276(+)
MKVNLIPVFEDNYAYLITDTTTNKALVVDPAEPETVANYITKENVELIGILTTHSHWDHAGGNNDMLERFPGIPVYGGGERVQGLTHLVHDHDEIEFGSVIIKGYFTPCHTTDHILYHFVGDSISWLFTGDTLFLGGCGKFFEGVGEGMHYALLDVVANLPGETLVYCGHEYSIGNLLFAQHVDPDNAVLQDKLEWCYAQRSQNLPTVPSTIAEELEYNPFMRVSNPIIKAAVGSTEDTDIQTMDKVREAKNNWKPNKQT